MKKLIIAGQMLSLVLAGSLQAKTYNGSDQKYKETNNFISDRVLEDMPYLFAVPKNAESKDPVKDSENDVVFDFYHKESDQIGLKLFFVSESLSERENNSKKFKSSGLIKNGDVLLTYHPEWGYTGGYTSAMTGISHAGLAYVSEDGERILNIDMPLNEAQNLDIRSNGKKSHLSSDHYVKHTKFVHIVRPKLQGNAEQQRKNLQAWAKAFEKQVRGASRNPVYPGKTVFNSSYLKPAYMWIDKGAQDYTAHVKDVARLATGKSVLNSYSDPETGQRSSALPLFCSDFVWSLQALKKCSPSEANTCNPEPAYNPLSLIGTKDEPGLAEAALIVLRAMNLSLADKELIHKKAQEVFMGPNGSHPRPMKNVSSGHRKAAEDIPNETYAALAQYVENRLMFELSGVPESQEPRELKILRAVLNGEKAFVPDSSSPGGKKLVDVPEEKRMPKNYSPTSFLINSLLPNSNNNKKFEYVGTIAYLSDGEMTMLKNKLAKDENQGVNPVNNIEPDDQPAKEEYNTSSASNDPGSELVALLGVASSDQARAKRCVKRNPSKPDYGLMHPVWGWAECQEFRKGLTNKGYNWKDYTVNGSL